MSPVVINLSRSFKNEVKKYSRKQQLEIWEKINIFRKNPFNSELKTHKLSGKLKNYWSFSINYSLRIMFIFIDDKAVDFINIGGHEIYK